MRLISVKMHEELVEKIDDLAMELGITRSELIRAAIIEYLKKHNKTYSKLKEDVYEDDHEYKEEVVVIK